MLLALLTLGLMQFAAALISEPLEGLPGTPDHYLVSLAARTALKVVLALGWFTFGWLLFLYALYRGW